MSRPKYLLDVNVLIALTDQDHEHHLKATAWFSEASLDWGTCAFTEAGFLRIAANPKSGAHSLDGATAVLADLVSRPGYCYWPISTDWNLLTAPFRGRIYGHQQITDAFLLGLAVHGDGILVTLDKGIQHLAGARLRQHLLVLV